jgi:tetratricopeptide (TPR) repeat protein
MFRIVLVVLLLAGTSLFSQDTKNTPQPIASDPLNDASRLFQQGQFDAAIQKYQQIIANNPKSSAAYAGLTRVYLKQENVRLADENITKGVQVADGPFVRVALGEVYFREGKISDAEREWVNVINSGHIIARAYLGLARINESLSFYKKAKEKLDKAHQLDPDDPDIQRWWGSTLSLSDRIKSLEEYLANVNNDDEKTRKSTQQYLDYLKARQKNPHQSCKLVGKVTATETKLVPLTSDAQHMIGMALSVTVNGAKSKLQLDTGASGILIDRIIAAKAGLTKISEANIRGIGDQGDAAGWVGLANSIKIGDMEFQNCPVRVVDRRSVVDEDGLIGSDVFSAFLVDLDFPDRKFKLTELPKRPGETDQSLALNTRKQNGEGEDEDDDSTDSKSGSPSPRMFFDAYTAPEMKDYTKIFRFGHLLLIPTKVGDASPKLFMIDTGAFGNSIDPAAAREVTHVAGDADMRIEGISGKVNKVYSADNAMLLFGHLKQPNQEMVSFDMTPVSNSVGTQVSGTLGFSTLYLLDLKIDYRDGLVDLSWDPNRLH